jgi:hypothetical protein
MAAFDQSADGLPTIYVGVPGPWADVDEAMQSVVEAGHGRYVGSELTVEEHGVAGIGVLDTQTAWACVCEFRPAMPNIAPFFLTMGYGHVTPRDADAVARHRSILVLMAPGGSDETAGYMMDCVSAALDADGLGVIIESTGIAHAPRDWRTLAAQDDRASGLYWAYVATIGPKGPRKRTIYTCGMHNLGERDAITEAFTDPQEAAYTIHTFLGYLRQSGQPVADGDEIGSEEGPMFRVVMEPCTTYPPADLFHNPYGMWRIVPR